MNQRTVEKDNFCLDLGPQKEHQEQSPTIDTLKKNGSFHYRLSFDITTTTTCQALGYHLEVGSTLHTMPYFFMFSFSEQLAA